MVLTTLYFAAGLSEVPTGAVCLSSSQVLAFGQAAVRLERSRDQRKERTLTRRKSLFVFVVSVFLSLFGSCFFVACSCCSIVLVSFGWSFF